MIGDLHLQPRWGLFVRALPMTGPSVGPARGDVRILEGRRGSVIQPTTNDHDGVKSDGYASCTGLIHIAQTSSNIAHRRRPKDSS